MSAMPGVWQAGESEPLSPENPAGEPRPIGKQRGTWGWEAWPSVPLPPQHPKELEALSPRSQGGPASLRRKTPRGQKGTFLLCSYSDSRPDRCSGGWDQEDSPVGGAGQGTRKGPGLGFL